MERSTTLPDDAAAMIPARGPGKLWLAALAISVALLLAGCGSGSSSISVGGAGSTAQSERGSGAAPQASSSPNSSSSSSGANSIQAYGSAAGAAQSRMLARTALSFFAAIAGREYARVCTELSASSLRQFRAFARARRSDRGCSQTLRHLIPSEMPDARRAARGKISSVRIKGDTAFVLFRPRGGVPSYFILRREAGAWRATSLAPGAPLNPTASAP